jgi:hypothetical protein
MRATCRAHLIVLDLINLTILGEEYGYEVHYAVFSTIRHHHHRLGTNIFNTLVSEILSLWRVVRLWREEKASGYGG